MRNVINVGKYPALYFFHHLYIVLSLSVVFEEKMKVDLTYPNAAVDQFGNIGTWTMVYNQVYSKLIGNVNFLLTKKYHIVLI